MESIKENSDVLSNKFGEMVLLMDRWIENLQNNKHVTNYFHRKSFQSIAIYGTSYLAQRLQTELESTDISIRLIFDKNSIDNLVGKEKDLDVIVVTSLYYYYEIKQKLSKITTCPIICIDDIIYRI